MLISGTRRRAIYPQDTVNWLFNLRPVSTGIFYFNFLSNSGDIFNIFSLKERKIYSTNNDFIGSYSTNSNLSLSGSITNGRVDLYNNNIPLYLGLSINEYDKITGFSLNSVGGNNIDFLNLNILGDHPEYFYDQSVTYRSGELIKINIVNNSDYDFNIFSGTVSNSNFSATGLNGLSILKNNSGYFYLINNGGFINFSNTNIVLDTDFGRQELRVSLSGIRLEDETYYLSVGPNVLSIYNNFYQDYNIVLRNANSANLSIELRYVSGITGDYFRPVQRTAFLENQEVSGFIAGSGFLYGEITGQISGFNSLRNYYEYGTGAGIARDFKIAEDQFIERDYNILASGLGDVYSLTSISATGSQNIIFSGDINIRGGLLTGFFSGIVTGLVPNAKRGWLDTGDGVFKPPSISEQNYNSICSLNINNPICSEYQFLYEYKIALKTGFITKFFNYTGDLFITFDPSETEIINLKSPVLFATGKTTGFFNITGAAIATGGRVSGKLIGNYLLDFEPGHWNIFKEYNGPVTGESFLPLSDNTWPFDPVKGVPFLQTSTGFFNGIVSTGLDITFCNPQIPAVLPLNIIPDSIYRSVCFKDDSAFNFQYYPRILAPLSGELERIYENSRFQIESGHVQIYEGHPTGGRTRISRLGNTPSGSGYFYHLFEGCVSLPGVTRVGSPGEGCPPSLGDAYRENDPNYNGGGWEETLVTMEPFLNFDTGINPSITDIDIEYNFLYPCDSTIISFVIDDANYYSNNNEFIFNNTGGNIEENNNSISLNLKCWSGCFSNWPVQESLIVNSGSIISLTKENSIFTSNGFDSQFTFYICDIVTNFTPHVVKLTCFNSPSCALSTLIYDIGEKIKITGNSFNGEYYIHDVNYDNNSVFLELDCDQPDFSTLDPSILDPSITNSFKECSLLNEGTQFYIYDSFPNLSNLSWCRFSSSSSSFFSSSSSSSSSSLLEISSSSSSLSIPSGTQVYLYVSPHDDQIVDGGFGKGGIWPYPNPKCFRQRPRSKIYIGNGDCIGCPKTSDNYPNRYNTEIYPLNKGASWNLDNSPAKINIDYLISGNNFYRILIGFFTINAPNIFINGYYRPAELKIGPENYLSKQFQTIFKTKNIKYYINTDIDTNNVEYDIEGGGTLRPEDMPEPRFVFDSCAVTNISGSLTTYGPTPGWKNQDFTNHTFVQYFACVVRETGENVPFPPEYDPNQIVNFNATIAGFGRPLHLVDSLSFQAQRNFTPGGSTNEERFSEEDGYFVSDSNNGYGINISRISYGTKLITPNFVFGEYAKNYLGPDFNFTVIAQSEPINIEETCGDQFELPAINPISFDVIIEPKYAALPVPLSFGNLDNVNPSFPLTSDYYSRDIAGNVILKVFMSVDDDIWSKTFSLNEFPSCCTCTKYLDPNVCAQFDSRIALPNCLSFSDLLPAHNEYGEFIMGETYLPPLIKALDTKGGRAGFGLCMSSAQARFYIGKKQIFTRPKTLTGPVQPVDKLAWFHPHEIFVDFLKNYESYNLDAYTTNVGGSILNPPVVQVTAKSNTELILSWKIENLSSINEQEIDHYLVEIARPSCINLSPLPKDCISFPFSDPEQKWLNLFPKYNGKQRFYGNSLLINNLDTAVDYSIRVRAVQKDNIRTDFSEEKIGRTIVMPPTNITGYNVPNGFRINFTPAVGRQNINIQKYGISIFDINGNILTQEFSTFNHFQNPDFYYTQEIIGSPASTYFIIMKTLYDADQTTYESAPSNTKTYDYLQGKIID